VEHLITDDPSQQCRQDLDRILAVGYQTDQFRSPAWTLVKSSGSESRPAAQSICSIRS